LARISRKELKQDEVVLEVGKTVEFVQANRDRLIVGGIVAVVLVIGGWGGYTLYSNRQESSSEALGKALETYHAPVRPVSLSDSPNEITFTTEQQRADAALRQFEPVADKYSMMRAGKLARYYVGLCDVDLGNLPEADKQLSAVVSSGDSYVQPLARLALAGVQTRENKAADAEQSYRYLVDHPGDSVPKITAQLALADFLGASKPAEAEKIYKELEAGKPDIQITDLIQKQRSEIAK
jgi:predicted negative regulator of RcsB-dependent stress response